jgi:hypothetical protein
MPPPRGSDLDECFTTEPQRTRERFDDHEDRNFHEWHAGGMPPPLGEPNGGNPGPPIRRGLQGMVPQEEGKFKIVETEFLGGIRPVSELFLSVTGFFSWPKVDSRERPWAF